jgi:UDP-N-acetylmuramoyl-tripeptide--D-alanyl-D-alanine ligase
MRIKVNDKKNFINMFNQTYKQDIEVINGISIDSREIEPYDIFIPIKGEMVDGHKFIENVLKIKGTICFDERTDILNKRIIKSKSNKEILINMASSWREKIKSEVIAITGSNGKTTTKELLYHIIKNKFKCSKSKDNHNSTIGLPLTFLNCNINDQYTILELGANKDGEIGKLCDAIKPNYSLITNISNSHIGNFDSIEEIAECKSKIFSYLDEDGVAFLNMNDEMIKKMDIKSKKITFAMNNKEAEYNGTLNQKSLMTINKSTFKIPRDIIHLNESILSVYAICNQLGIEDEIIQKALNTFTIPNGRGSIIDNNKYIIINDAYNASPASMKFGIKRFSEMKKTNRKILIIGDMLELGDYAIPEHKKLAKIINLTNIDIVFTIGSLMLYTYEKLNDNYNLKSHFSNINNLKNEFKKIVEKDDIVFIKGSRKMTLERIYN